MKKVYIALGTNIEPRKEYIDESLSLLGLHNQINIEKQSSIYETAPVGYLDQSHFLNLVINITTELSALELLDATQAIENKLGRERTIKNGPRTIDLDILVYNDEEIQTDRLTTPHPRMHNRAFVLIPLKEIAPELLITPFEMTVSELIKQLPANELEDVVKWE